MKKSGSKREFEFEPSFEEEDDQCIDQESGQPDKKRRLRADQVKALERSFESENKLEPERKVQLAIELGLDPRQVAIWFQNRRARWKTKKLERDYVVLQSAFDELKRSYDAVRRENETLVQQIGEIKAKMKSEKEEIIGDGEGDGGFGLSFNYETPAFCSNVNVVSSDSATSGVQRSEESSPPNGVVSSCELLLPEDAQCSWPASYTFLADEEPAPMFNWYCPDPWT